MPRIREFSACRGIELLERVFAPPTKLSDPDEHVHGGVPVHVHVHGHGGDHDHVYGHDLGHGRF